MTGPMLALVVGLALTFIALHAIDKLEGSGPPARTRASTGVSPAAGAGPRCPARVPRRRHVGRHFSKWSERTARLFLTGGALRLK
jgi:hypothetical protein